MQSAILSDWRVPPHVLTLSCSEVHVWRLALTGNVELLHDTRQLLSELERARADRFHFERDRRQYTLTRGILRILLGKYLAAQPGRVRISYGPCKKPYVAESENPLNLHFNVSHAGVWALLAFCRGRKVGVDIESSQRLNDWQSVAARIFSARERDELDSLPPAQKRTAFLNGWTRKESYLKATGEGLIDALDEIEVVLSPGARARLRAVHGDTNAARKWALHTLQPADGFVGALAVEGDAMAVRQWEWTRTLRAKDAAAI